MSKEKKLDTEGLGAVWNKVKEQIDTTLGDLTDETQVQQGFEEIYGGSDE